MKRLEGTVQFDIGMNADFWEDLLAGPARGRPWTDCGDLTFSEADTSWTKGPLAVWRGMPAGSPALGEGAWQQTYRCRSCKIRDPLSTMQELPKVHTTCLGRGRWLADVVCPL